MLKRSKLLTRIKHNLSSTIWCCILSGVPDIRTVPSKADPQWNYSTLYILARAVQLPYTMVNSAAVPATGPRGNDKPLEYPCQWFHRYPCTYPAGQQLGIRKRISLISMQSNDYAHPPSASAQAMEVAGQLHTCGVRGMNSRFTWGMAAAA
ncbi:hypothetical protein BD779DRAFT_292055 [Infundibulicybe gibba]|nr:hypothetical protein BD779DRAFT_292055 [Infundibulicybe gibba]